MFSNRCLHSLDVLCSIQVNIYEIAFSKVVIAMFDEVVLGETPLEAHTLLLVEFAVSDRGDIECALAEGNSVA